ncbi:DUF6099 family protein [Streptomyces fragilis]|uniref:DUF6099 family protein n=1 Tax=Streptomyces fragilis TaxID=67301 RepID=UPI003558514B
MDAVRLIEAGRRALAVSEEPKAVVAEVWQAHALAQAVGSRLAVYGPPELRGEAIGLAELAGRGCGVLGQAPFGAEHLRAARLSSLGDPSEVLEMLGELLSEAGIAMIGLAPAAPDDDTYWQCMEAIDAADESRDRVLQMIRRLSPDGGAAGSGSVGGGAGGGGPGRGGAERGADRATPAAPGRR